MCFNPRFFLVVDRPDRKVAFEILERFFDLRELDVVTPQLGGIAAGEIGAQQIRLSLWASTIIPTIT